MVMGVDRGAPSKSVRLEGVQRASEKSHNWSYRKCKIVAIQRRMRDHKEVEEGERHQSKRSGPSKRDTPRAEVSMCCQSAKVGHIGTREIRYWKEVW